MAFVEHPLEAPFLVVSFVEHPLEAPYRIIFLILERVMTQGYLIIRANIHHLGFGFFGKFKFIVFQHLIDLRIGTVGPALLSNSCCFARGTGNISPFPNILLTPVDARPLNAPVASGATILALFLLLLEELFLLKRMQARQEIPLFYFEQIFAFYLCLYQLLFYLLY